MNIRDPKAIFEKTSPQDLRSKMGEKVYAKVADTFSEYVTDLPKLSQQLSKTLKSIKSDAAKQAAITMVLDELATLHQDFPDKQKAIFQVMRNFAKRMTSSTGDYDAIIYYRALMNISPQSEKVLTQVAKNDIQSILINGEEGPTKKYGLVREFISQLTSNILSSTATQKADARGNAVVNTFAFLDGKRGSDEINNAARVVADRVLISYSQTIKKYEPETWKSMNNPVGQKTEAAQPAPAKKNSTALMLKQTKIENPIQALAKASQHDDEIAPSTQPKAQRRKIFKREIAVTNETKVQATEQHVIKVKN